MLSLIGDGLLEVYGHVQLTQSVLTIGISEMISYHVL